MVSGRVAGGGSVPFGRDAVLELLQRLLDLSAGAGVERAAATWRHQRQNVCHFTAAGPAEDGEQVRLSLELWVEREGRTGHAAASQPTDAGLTQLLQRALAASRGGPAFERTEWLQAPAGLLPPLPAPAGGEPDWPTLACAPATRAGLAAAAAEAANRAGVALTGWLATGYVEHAALSTAEEPANCYALASLAELRAECAGAGPGRTEALAPALAELDVSGLIGWAITAAQLPPVAKPVPEGMPLLLEPVAAVPLLAALEPARHETAAQAPVASAVAAGTQSVSQLIARLGTGLVVGRWSGTRYAPGGELIGHTAGDAFWVENGRVLGRAQDIGFAAHPALALAAVQAAGRTMRWVRCAAPGAAPGPSPPAERVVRAPALLLADFPYWQWRGGAGGGV